MTTEFTDASVKASKSKLQASEKPQTASFNASWDWAPLIVLPWLALMVRGSVSGWVFMWFMAGAIFEGCKCMTWRRAWRGGPRPTIKRSLAYFFLWPGMDAEAFLAKMLACGTGGYELWRRWVPGVARACIGVVLIALAARDPDWNPLVAGWVGMMGVVLVLHFGIFEVLAIAWQRVGINAQPIMRAPLRATSLGEFWSRRWNTAFNNLAHELAFRPLASRWGAKGAMLGVFLISGLVHEAVISLPARGGYGFPTAYFLLQGGGILLERSPWGCRTGLGSGLKGRLFAMAFAALPAFWLFHPPFVRNVILPMLRFIGQN